MKVSPATTPFEFLDPGELVDGELQVVLAARNAPISERDWLANYDFELRVDGQCAGEINFRAGTNRNIEMYGGHFGYGVKPEFRGRRFAERGVRLLLPFVRRHGITPVWITCNPDNWPSRRTCERLGAILVEIVPLPPDNDQYLEGDREKCRYRIDL